MSSVIPKTMRAVVYRGVNDLRLEMVPVPRISSTELLVKVEACGICPTDLKKIHYGTLPPPRIYGHETAGTIVRLGARVRGFRLGDRVALHHHVPCLDCHACRHGAFAQCPQNKRTGITAGFEPAGGGYGDYVRVMSFVLPGVVKIPAKNSFVEGAMQEPVNTVLKAVKKLSLLRGDTVLVAGQGPIGLIFTRLLVLAGMKVVASDLMESRLKLARSWGARWAFSPADQNFADLVRRVDARAGCRCRRRRRAGGRCVHSGARVGAGRGAGHALRPYPPRRADRSRPGVNLRGREGHAGQLRGRLSSAKGGRARCVQPATRCAPTGNARNAAGPDCGGVRIGTPSDTQLSQNHGVARNGSNRAPAKSR